MIYVLIIVALFAALSLTLARQTDTSETGTLSTYEVEILASQILQSSGAVKQAIDQMLYSGVEIDDLDFVQPDDEPAYSTASTTSATPHGDKVFHPLGGGLILPQLPANAFNQIGTDPVAGVYLGRFSNVEWSPSTAQDVIYTVYQIRKEICAKINENLFGNKIIPPLANNLNSYLVDNAFHTAPNWDFTSLSCPTCDEPTEICVSNSAGTGFAFMSIVEME